MTEITPPSRKLIYCFIGPPLDALLFYQKAEFFLIDMVKRGEDMYKKSLLAAISGQQQARTHILSEEQ